MMTMWRTLSSWFASIAKPSVVSGTVADIHAQIQRLLDAPAGSSLIVEVSGVEDAFLQFTAGPETIQIDHPLITAEQVRREAALRTEFEAAGLPPYETKGADGLRFLDCDVPRDAAGVAVVVQRLLQSQFGANPSTELRFIGNGLTPVA